MTERICIISLSSYGYFNEDAVPGGGAQRQLYLLSQELQAEFDVHFVVGDYGQPRIETRDGVTLHRAYDPAESGGIPTQVTQFVCLWRAMRRADADVYVYRGRPWKAAFVYLIARLLRKGFVYNIANDPNLTDQPAALPLPVRLLYVRALEDADAVITQTEKQRELLRSGYGLEGKRVPNGYPPAEDPLPQERRAHFLWVGRIDEHQKQPHLYLDLAERIPAAQFLLIGPGGSDETYNERITSRADSLSNVSYLGVVSPDTIHEYYREAFALVNTSAYEGFPNTFLEAWRYETPVLSYLIDPERFVGTELGGCADGDFDELVATTEEVARSPSRRRELAEPAARYFEEALTIETVAQAYGEVLAQVCS